jgi:hypothetical protein
VWWELVLSSTTTRLLLWIILTSLCGFGDVYAQLYFHIFDHVNQTKPICALYLNLTTKGTSHSFSFQLSDRSSTQLPLSRIYRHLALEVPARPGD